MPRVPSITLRVLPACAAVLLAGCASTAQHAGPALAGEYQRGDIVVLFGADGSTRGSTVHGDEWQRGVYTVDGDRVQITDQWMADAYRDTSCVGKGTGTYRWRLAGDALTLEPIDEPCASRAEGVTGGAWTRR
ncbi:MULTISPECIES: hypothetical protein [Luteimonas]|uniref:hypothetical protein n=1 Tax=Luteimonas TaxID=83614 RepID=UPI000C7AF3C1|nr:MULTISPECIES: hypothetical protein [Luteimonas]